MKRLIKFLLYVVSIYLLSRAWYIYWVKTNEKAAMLYAIPGAVMLITAIAWEVYVYFSLSKRLERQNKKAALIAVELETPQKPHRPITEMTWYKRTNELWDLIVSKLKYEKFNLKVVNIIVVAIATTIYTIGSIWNFSYYREIAISFGFGGVTLLSLGFYIKKAIKEYREKRRQMQPVQEPEKKKLAQVWSNDIAIFFATACVYSIIYLYYGHKNALVPSLTLFIVCMFTNHAWFFFKDVKKTSSTANSGNTSSSPGNKPKGYKDQLKKWFNDAFMTSGVKSIMRLGYFVFGILLGLIATLIDRSIASGLIVFALFLIAYYPIYYYLASIIGDGANTRTEWFTAVGENEIKFVVNQSGQPVDILTPKKFDINDDGMLIRVENGNNRPTFFGGLYWVGIPPLRKIFTYKWSWVKLVEEFKKDDEGTLKRTLVPVERKEDSINSLRIRQQQYVEVTDLETSGTDRVFYKYLVTYYIIFPRKALFKNDSPGNWLTKAKAEIESTSRSHVANKDFKSLNAEDQGIKNPDSIVSKLLAMSGHEFKDGDYVPKKINPDDDKEKLLIYSTGVAIIDLEIVDFGSAEDKEFKEVLRLKQKASLEADAETEVQRKANTKQDGENARKISASLAEATALSNVADKKGAYYKAINDNGGKEIEIAEKLSESGLLSIGSSTLLNLGIDEHMKNRPSRKRRGGPNNNQGGGNTSQT